MSRDLIAHEKSRESLTHAQDVIEAHPVIRTFIEMFNCELRQFYSFRGFPSTTFRLNFPRKQHLPMLCRRVFHWRRRLIHDNSLRNGDVSSTCESYFRFSSSSWHWRLCMLRVARKIYAIFPHSNYQFNYREIFLGVTFGDLLTTHPKLTGSVHFHDIFHPHACRFVFFIASATVAPCKQFFSCVWWISDCGDADVWSLHRFTVYNQARGAINGRNALDLDIDWGKKEAHERISLQQWCRPLIYSKRANSIQLSGGAERCQPGAVFISNITDKVSEWCN